MLTPPVRRRRPTRPRATRRTVDAARLRERPSFGGFDLHSLECSLNDVIARARCLLEPSQIQDRNFAAFIADELPVLERARCLRNALAPHAQHMRKKFMRETKFIRHHPLA